jgi:hydroxymethylpyrimidine pyrophosphatase-like HAD family hydrolase
LSIGNDYNDLDMLNITQYAFVVSNSPQELLENPKFKVVSTNNLDGFSNAVEIIYGKN